MERIEIVNYIKFPVDKVYKTLTTQKGLCSIWPPKLDVKSEIGCINEFDFDEEYITKFRIIDLKENEKILWKCVESDEEWIDTGVSFKLSFHDGITTVKFSHFDWKKVTEYYGWCNYNWSMFLMRLKKYCESNEIKH